MTHPKQNLTIIAVAVALLLLSPLYYGTPLKVEMPKKVDKSITKTLKNVEFLTSDTVTLGQLGLHKQDMIYLGEFKITHYTNSPDENDGYVDCLGNGITVTGNPIISGYTVAVKHGSIPYGTVIYIEGLGDYVVDDCGVGAGQIDIAVDSKETAYELGVQYKAVWILKGETG